MPSKEFSFCNATSLSTSINKSPSSWWQLPIEVRHDNHRRKMWFSTCFGYLSGLCLRYDFLLWSFLLLDERRDEWRFHTTPAWNETRNRDSCTELLHMAPPAFWRKRWNFHVFIFLFLCCFRSQVINTQLYWLRGAKRARINAQYPLRWIWANRIAILWFLMKIEDFLK
jgi:hypothetical protein